MDKKDFIGNTLINIYFAIVCLIFSVILAGSVFGAAGLYQPVYVFPLVFISFFLLLVGLRQSNTGNIRQMLSVNKLKELKLSDHIIYLITIIMIVLLILIPVARWPKSIAGDWFPWDAGKYHFPKAVEMIRSGSANDLTIAYGEYPFGYESLLSFCLLISDDAGLFGWMHTFIDLFFILSFWLLAKRYTGMRSSLLLFLVTLVILSNFFFQFFNLWRIFQTEIYTVGKNDLLLAASILSFLFFYPFPDQEGFDMRPMLPAGAAGMIALSVKPNAVFIIMPLWILLGGKAIYNWWKKEGKRPKQSIFLYLIASFIMVPGVIWLLRNLILTGKMFSGYVLEASTWSIASNLTNPFLYQYLSKNVYLIIGLVSIMVLLSIKNFQRYGWKTGILLLLMIGFIFTPVTAFFLRTDIPATISWRFGQAMLAYIFIMLLLLVSDLLEKIKFDSKIRKSLEYLSIPFLIMVSMGVIWSQPELFEKKPENAVILRDQFREPVGVGGYYSAYGFVQENIRDSIVWVENGLPYYAYGAGYTNSVSREKSADYIVVIKTDWFGDGGLEIPSYFKPDSWRENYTVIYEDPQGIVFALKR